ncbi:MAG: glycogen synthase GlgA [Tissierellia bacterium]|jgi:starch synthase|nr:glycogen synthase GlgA [Tissierellia bacterium]
MKILYASSEVAPFIKTGGLADVAGSLPKSIRKASHDIRVVLPLYSQIKDKYMDDLNLEKYYFVVLGWRRQYVGVYSLKKDNITYYFLDNEYYFKRTNIYGEYDDGERFIYFQKALVCLLKEIDFKADIVHCNDWHTGLVPLYIKDFAKDNSFYSDIKTIYTIHNIKYQGIFPDFILWEIGGLSGEYANYDGLRHSHDTINFMKAGIVYSDAFTTVSHSYAQEIKTGEYSEGLDQVIINHSNKLRGIVNGIDYEVYNPETDTNLKALYNIDTIDKKKLNKIQVQKLYNLPINEDIPMIAMVTRLADLKGLDLVIHILEELLEKEDIQFVLLGTGEKTYEDSFKYFQSKYPSKLASRNYFDEGESHLIYAGADMFLMPSLAEPCGISQLIALRYGTIPIVRETGGLKDTVEPFNIVTNEGNGFAFRKIEPEELLEAIKKALTMIKDDEKWTNIIKNAMNSKNDWEKSSEEYIKLYKELA